MEKEKNTHTHNSHTQKMWKNSEGKTGEYYSFLSVFDRIIILINSVYYVLSFLRLYTILRSGYQFQCKEHTQTLTTTAAVKNIRHFLNEQFRAL